MHVVLARWSIYGHFSSQRYKNCYGQFTCSPVSHEKMKLSYQLQIYVCNLLIKNAAPFPFKINNFTSLKNRGRYYPKRLRLETVDEEMSFDAKIQGGDLTRPVRNHSGVQIAVFSLKITRLKSRKCYTNLSVQICLLKRHMSNIS